MTSLRERRLAQLRRLGQSITITDPGQILQSSRPLVGVTCSRLGHDSKLQKLACRFLSRSVLDVRARQGQLLVASGSAMEPWAVRAAELFGVDLIRVAVHDEDSSADVIVRQTDGAALCRDEVLICLADRIDAIYVRRGGKIVRAIEQRMAGTSLATTRVAIMPMGNCAGVDLVQLGAVGWYQPGHDTGNRPVARKTRDVPSLVTHQAWAQTQGDWLVHCTRGRRGPWPDQTKTQYLDEMLIGEEQRIQRSPLQALCRILRSGRLLASSVTSARDYPVVCFTELSLLEILSRRCYRSHLGRWDYEPFGVAIRLSAAKQFGIAPVIYGDASMRGSIAPHDRYRFQATSKKFDWTAEREWRSQTSVPLDAFAPDDLRVFALDSVDARKALQAVAWPITWLNRGAEQVAAEEHSGGVK